MLTPSQLDELCARSAKGDGVTHVLTEWNIPVQEALLWLQKNAHDRLKKAKSKFAADDAKKIAALKDA